MAVVEVASDTFTSVIDTPEVLPAQEGGHVYVLIVEVAEMLGGDTLVVTLSVLLHELDVTPVIIAQETLTGALGGLGGAEYISVPVPAAWGLEAEIEQTDGSPRDYRYSLLAIGVSEA